MRTIKKSFRFSEADYAVIQEKSALAKMSEAEFIRTMLHKSTIRIDPRKNENAEILRDRNFALNRIGVNLNQIARFANQEGPSKLAILEKLIELERMINAL